MRFGGRSGISWTVCKQSAPRSRQITTPTPYLQDLENVCPGICVADTDAKIYFSAHLCSVFEQFLCYFFTACDSDGHILQYGCCCHTIYRYG